MRRLPPQSVGLPERGDLLFTQACETELKGTDINENDICKKEAFMKPRALKFDLIRITAICMVLFIHVTVVLVLFYHDATFTVANVFNGLGRAGVPMFLLLSGALLLDEDRPFDTKKFYRTSFLSIVLLLVGWLLFYASWRAFLLPLLRGKPTDPKHFVTYLLTLKGLYPHLWYLFMLVGAYLAVPFLRLFVKKANKPYILGFILLSVIVGFGATTFGVFTRDADVTVGSFLTKFHFEYATGYLPYLLIGWYLTTFPPKKAMRFVLYGLGLAAALICVFGVQAWVKDIPDIRDYLVEATTLPALLYGVGLFTLICALAGDRETKSPVIRALSRASFGVYILHVAVLDVLVNILLPYKAFGEQYPLWYILTLFALTAIGSLIVVLPLSKVKGVRKIFHY